MSDFFEKVTGGQDMFTKLAGKIPGFSGYVDRQSRRAADKLMRETVARRFEELHKRATNIQTDMISNGMVALIDDMEKAAQQLRMFMDKISTASYGMSGLFDAVKINEAELAQLYTFDSAFFDSADQINHALDNIEASMGDETALPAAIRNMVTLARQAVDTFNRRAEVITGSK